MKPKKGIAIPFAEELSTVTPLSHALHLFWRNLSRGFCTQPFDIAWCLNSLAKQRCEILIPLQHVLFEWNLVLCRKVVSNHADSGFIQFNHVLECGKSSLQTDKYCVV